MNDMSTQDMDLANTPSLSLSDPFNSIISSASQSNHSHFDFNSSSNETPKSTFILEVEDNSIFKNSTALFRMLRASEFGKLGITYVTKNISRSLIILTTKYVSPKDRPKYTQICFLGDFKINTKVPDNVANSFGVIGPIGVDTPLEEIYEELIQDYPDITKVDRIYRQKGTTKEPTLSIKLTFKCQELPKVIYFAYEKFEVSVYVDKPWQCYKCQGYGHNSKECKYKARCLICAGPHQFRDCPNKNDANFNARCPNCNGNHAANYGGCPNYKVAKKVEQVRAIKRISYKDALLEVKKDNLQSNIPNRTYNPSTQGAQLSYAQITNASVPNPINANLGSQCLMPSQVNASLPSQMSNTQVPAQITQCPQSSGKIDDSIIKKLLKIMITLVRKPPSNVDDIIPMVNETLGTTFNESDLLECPEDASGELADTESEGNESNHSREPDGFKTPRKRKSKGSPSKNSSNDDFKRQRVKQKTPTNFSKRNA